MLHTNRWGQYADLKLKHNYSVALPGIGNKRFLLLEPRNSQIEGMEPVSPVRETTKKVIKSKLLASFR